MYFRLLEHLESRDCDSYKKKEKKIFTLIPFIFLTLQSDRQQKSARDRPFYPRESKKKKKKNAK